MSNPSIDTGLDAVLSFPHACIGVQAPGERLLRVQPLAPDTPLVLPRSPLAVEVALQLGRFLRDGGYRFELPLADSGTEFQRRVWRRLRVIPCGHVLSYGDLAAELGSSARAVANACRDNPFPVVVPCHRVIGKDGLGGYAGFRDGWATEFKRWLLEHEYVG